MAALVLGLVAIALYAPLIGWGIPYATAPDRIKTFSTDEILPLEGLAEMHNTFVVSKPDRNYGYPWWHYFVVAVAQAPYLGLLMLSGGLQSPSPVFPFGFQDPLRALRVLTLIGRFVSVLMAAGAVVAAYHFARALWGHATGVVAAVLTMLNYLVFYYSRTGNLDVPGFFWSSVGLAIFAKILVEGLTARRGAWLGVCAGLAMGTKDQALVVFLPLASMLLLPHFNHPPQAAYRVRPLVVGLVVTLVTYLIATGMVVDPRRHITHVYALFFDQTRLTGAAAYWPPQPRTWAGTMRLMEDFVRGLVVTSSLPVILTSAAGVVLTARSLPWQTTLLLPVLSLFLVLVLPTGIVILRYWLPMTLIIDGFAARAVLGLRHSRLRAAWVPLIVGLCGWRLLIGIDLSYAQYHETRDAAAQWLRAHVRPGERIEYFGVGETLPPLPAEISTRRVAGRVHWVGEVDHGPATLQYLAQRGPEFIVIIPDWTSQPGMERSADCPVEVFNALLDGSAGYTLAAYFPSRSLLPGLLRRPPLDNPSVCPPVRIFARRDIADRSDDTSRIVASG